MDSLAAISGLLPVAGALFLGKPIDATLLIIFAAIKRWEYVTTIISLFNTTIAITTIATTIALFILLQIIRYTKALEQPSSACLESDFPVKPMLFPSETAHVRIFPQTHGFKYSYLLVGIPVGWSGSVGGMISSDVEPRKRPWYSLQPGSAWYTVNGDDYLLRGHVEGGLKGKLDQYLVNEGINPAKYAHAYLLTAARFLNYASNPVSIWHLYSASKELTALILEVNNTFDEKRIYFLEPSSTPPSKGADEKASKQAPRYTQTWPKDFYVSVFNSRNGSYSLSAADPFCPHMNPSHPTIDTTITLNNSSSSAKLVARVYSAGEALDPTTMSVWEKTVFIAKWWWVGLATFPRTVREALTLLMRRRMPWVFRPEPRSSTISRKADETEILVERLFRRWLREKVESSYEDAVVRYVSAGLVEREAEEEVISSASAQLSPGTKELEVRVLTPLFYSRVMKYDDLADALWTESTESATISVSPDLFPKSIFSSYSKLTRANSGLAKLGIRLSLLNLLRKRPTPIPIPTKERSATPPQSWSQESSKGYGDEGGSFNTFVASSGSEDEKKLYFSHVAKLMSADLLALGSMELLDLEIFLLRGTIMWVAVKLVL